MNNWWTKEDFEEFNKRVGKMVDIFDGLQYGPAKINGKQVVSENIADLAGLACAVQTGKNDGVDLKDLFENYARSWMEKQRPEAIKTEVQNRCSAPQPTRLISLFNVRMNSKSLLVLKIQMVCGLTRKIELQFGKKIMLEKIFSSIILVNSIYR